MVNVVAVKGGIQIQFNDGRVGFVRWMDCEKLAYAILNLVSEKLPK